MKKLAIVHFHALEQYPPVTNLIKYIEVHNSANVEVEVFTASPVLNQTRFHSPAVTIRRWTPPGESKTVVSRFYRYLVFYSQIFFALLKYRPTEVLYFETLSFLPVYVYRLFMKPLGKSPRIFCHYHEYMSTDEYENGMFLTRFINKLEKRNYTHMEWISHTNEDRMRLFKMDNKDFDFGNAYILPNYPPSNWQNTNKNSESVLPIRIVLVGSIGMETMYIKEFAQWVESENGRVVWDIYSFQKPDAILEYLSTINSKYIYFKGPVNYYDLPEVLKQYQVGVILYKGHIPNCVYIAPNKLFEYYACGLDTWFPVEMETSKDYVTNNVYPRIVAVDFRNMEKIDITRITEHSNLNFQKSTYYCEKVLDPLWKKLSMT